MVSIAGLVINDIELPISASRLLVTFDKLILWFVHSFSSCTRLVPCSEIYLTSRLKFSASFHLRQTPPPAL